MFRGILLLLAGVLSGVISDDYTACVFVGGMGVALMFSAVKHWWHWYRFTKGVLS